MRSVHALRGIKPNNEYVENSQTSKLFKHRTAISNIDVGVVKGDNELIKDIFKTML